LQLELFPLLSAFLAKSGLVRRKLTPGF